MAYKDCMKNFSVKNCVNGFAKKCTRTKTVDPSFFDTSMKRCLKLLDIILLGTGHMIGAGIYILSGAAVKNTAGPSIVISYIFSGFAAFLAAICYAEFGGRVPKAGSAYSYGYVTVGEFWGFIIGWDMLLENMIGAAALAVAWSGYLDELCDSKVTTGINSLVGKIHDPSGILGEKLELIAPALIITVSVFMGIGAKTSTTFNNIFAIINLIVIAFTVIFGLTFATPVYWTDPGNCTAVMACANDTIRNCTSVDAFMPYGFGGVIKGAAQVFFGYVGFESIASAGEETINPQRTIPMGTLIAMVIVTASYILMAITISMMIPFCQINVKSAFAAVFSDRGAVWAKYIVAVGALSGMLTVLFGSLFATPRGVYAMSDDGLLPPCLGFIYKRTQTPLVGVVLFGIISAILSLVFNLEVLAEFVSIGTLMAYSIVACSIIVLRYKPNAANFGGKEGENLIDPDAGKLKRSFSFLDPLVGRYRPGSVVTYVSAFMVLNMFCLAAMIHFGNWSAPSGQWWSGLLLVFFALTALGCCLLIFAFEPAKATLQFKTPLVPFLPALSLLINIIFMLHLPGLTWLRFGIWLLIGCCIYFTYGMWHSNENVNQRSGAHQVHPTAPLDLQAGRMERKSVSNPRLMEMKPIEDHLFEPPPPYSMEHNPHISNVFVEDNDNYYNDNDNYYTNVDNFKKKF